MSRSVLTIFCATQDAEAISAALRASTHAPIHMRREEVLGRDFADAGNGERVTGSLARTAIELELPAGQVAQAVEAAAGARRRLAFRWRTTAVQDGGRVA